MTVVVIKDPETKTIMGHPVMCKGRSMQEAVTDVTRSIERLDTIGSFAKPTKNPH